MRSIKFRRILSFILAIIMVLTLPITAYAAGGKNEKYFRYTNTL